MKKLLAFVLIAYLSYSCKNQQSVKKETDQIQEEIVVQEVPTGQLDTLSGLISDPNLYLVKAHCTSCHSSKLITSNRFSRDGWKDKIVWMQKTQGLWDLGEMEPAVLDYLTKYYGPVALENKRREPLTKIDWYKLNP